MEWEKASWNLETAVDEISSSALAEAEITLPPEEEGALRFLCCRAWVEEVTGHCGPGTIKAEGVISFTVLYETASGLASAASRNGFEHTLTSEKLQAGQRVQMRAVPLSQQVRWVDERTCRVECVLELQAWVKGSQERSLLTGLREEGLEEKHTALEGAYYTGTARQNAAIREDLELPPEAPEARQILECRGRVRLEEVTCQAGQARVRGVVVLSLLYSTATAQRMARTELEIPLAQEWVAPELAQAAWLVGEGQVQQCRVTVYTDLKEERRVLAVEARAALTVQGFAPQSAEALTDAYSPETDIRLTTERWTISGAPQQAQSEQEITGLLALPGGATPPERVVQVLAQPVPENIAVEEGRVLITGQLVVNVLHLSGQERMLGCISGTIPFEVTVAAPGLRPGDWIQAEIASLRPGAQPEAEALRLRDTLGISLCWQPVRETEAALEGSAESWKEALQPGLLLVIAQRGEDNWTVAKRCRTPLAQLVAANPQLRERQVQPGECLVVEKMD